jgi:N-carbamoyl-L-amino-acid hydrolase
MPLYAIDAARLDRTLQGLGRFGDTPYGMDRLAFSPADIASRAYTMDLMRRAGLETRTDTAGNIIGRKAGSEPSLPALALGSHTDTVPFGGKYDGALGVMAAVEVVQTLQDHGHTTRHPIEVMVFTNEEGTRYHRWLIGSRAMAGLLETEDLDAVDDEGVSLSSRMNDIGGDLSRVDDAVRQAGELAAYFELHIEQGPNLHRTGANLAVVTGITGRAVFEVDIEGMTNHAGTTPMAARRDALVSASKLVLDIQKMAAEDEICRVSTVGSIQAGPGAVNVIPGTARLGLEFRDLSMDALAAAERELERAAQRSSAADGVDITVTRHRFSNSVPIASGMQSLAAKAVEECGLSWEHLPSGAGHDAQAIASIAPMAMLFVPSVDGISHARAEYSTPEDCANGAQALMELLLMADQQA